jgi:uncharacterized membrane protein YccC
VSHPLVEAIFGFDRRKLRPITAVRCTLGLALPVLGFWYLGHLSWGILAGLGAIYGGLASFRGVYRERFRNVVATTLLMVLVTIIGNLVSSNPYLSVAAVTIGGFILSLYAAVRPSASQLTTLAIGTLIILSKVLKAHGDVWAMAIGNAGLILAGGASQVLMLSLFAPFTSHFPERNAIAIAFESLGDFAGELARGGEPQMMDGSSLQNARDIMEGLDQFRMKPEQIALRRALSAAEGIRACLVGIALASEEMRPKIAPFLFLLQARFNDVAEAARHSHLTDGLSKLEADLPHGVNEHVEQSLSMILAILDHLNDPTSRDDKLEKPKTDWARKLSPRLLALSLSVSLRSIAMRHAARAALVLAVATSISRFGAFGNGYWIPLTAAMILRPDYASTISVGVARAFGTLSGVLLGVAIARGLHPSLEWHVAIVIASTFAFSLCYLANYATFTAMVTLWVIFSVSASGIPETLIGMQRLEATLLGAAVAVVAYLLVPDWQSGKVQQVLKDAVQAQIEFCDKVLLATKLPADETWEKLLDGARALRYEAESVVQAAEREPFWIRKNRGPAINQVLSDLEMNAALLLALHSRRLANEDGGPVFVDQVESVRERSEELMLLVGV